MRPARILLPLLGAALALVHVASAGDDSAKRTKLAYRVVDTGQVTCHDDRGEIAWPKTGKPWFGQDAQYAGHAPEYEDKGDGTVIDENSGLMWQKTPDFVTRSWEDAGRYAEALELAGHTDWRLPTIKELFSIADFRGSMRSRTPYIDTQFFDFEYPDTSTGARDIDAQYWSSNRYVGTTMRGDQSAFGFNFADGRIKSYPVRIGGRRGPGGDDRRARKHVRCVRGPAYGRNDFADNGDGTVTDRATGLTWMKADSGKPMTWRKALAYAEGLTFAGKDDWRLPNVRELQSIVDYGRAPDAAKAADRGAAIDPVFTLTETESWFWTSTTDIENGFGYYVCFGQAFSARIRDGKKMNAHGAGAVRSDPKSGDPSDY
ncbi:MAG: Lcl C-terminal domain-containing protein, partial [Planctomycetota bacterium]